MIAKISHSSNMLDVLSYNQLKVDKETGQILSTQKIIERLDGSFSIGQLYRSFEPYFIANKKTEKPVLHISLNPDPTDKVNDEQFVKMAQEYMERMGYGGQPYIVFKHTDIERPHIHIVSICVDHYGEKISDTYEWIRSMNACRLLEQKYNLVPAAERQHRDEDQVFFPVDYKMKDVKSQIAAVVRYLSKYYQYPNFGAYNDLLLLFNITAKKVQGEMYGQPKNGLVYFALNEHGEKASNPFKASLFGKQTGLTALEEHFALARDKMKADPIRSVLKHTIEGAMYSTINEIDFKRQLMEQGVDTVVRRNGNGQIYRITFIDHDNHTVWNSSNLSKSLSASIFNNWWKKRATEQFKPIIQIDITGLPVIDKNDSKEKEEIHSLFDFLDEVQPINNFGLIDRLNEFPPQIPRKNYEQQKKKKKRYLP